MGRRHTLDEEDDDEKEGEVKTEVVGGAGGGGREKNADDCRAFGTLPPPPAFTGTYRGQKI